MNKGVIIAILLLICVSIYTYLYNSDSINNNFYEIIEIVDDEQILRFKQAFKQQHLELTLNEQQTVDGYKFNQSETLFNADTANWDDDNIEFRKLIQFGFKLLNTYAANNTLEQYLRISTDIVLRVGRIVNKLFLINVIHIPKIKKNKEKKKKDVTSVASTIKPSTDSELAGKKLNYSTFSEYIPRLMVMYEYIGNDACIKKYVCHPIITKLIHALNKSLDITESGPNMVQFAFPRLLSNYLFDRETYQNEKESPLFQELCELFKLTYNSSADGLKNGVYEDGSYLYHNVPRYSNLLLLHGFYENIFACFDVTYNSDDIIQTIIDKLFHPNIPYVTFGLYGDTGERTTNIIGKLGITIMPYIGLGIFKNDNFMFSLRIQRPNIAAFFKPSKDSEETFALGWIQLRKIYLKNVTYPPELTWDLLIKEPGIILLEGQNTYAKLIPKKENESNIYTQNINSFIGRIPNEDVMFWKNQYAFPEYYRDIIITEMGVVTNNGVEIFYCINKEVSSGRNLLLRVSDPDNPNLYSEPQSSDGLAPLTREGLILRMVFDKTNSVKIRQNVTTQNMEFEYNSYKYTIEVSQPNLTYIVKVTHKDEVIGIFGGSSKSERNDTMVISTDTEITKRLVRVPETYMYS